MEREGSNAIVTIRKKRSGFKALWAAVRLHLKARPNRQSPKKVVQVEPPKEDIKALESNETTWKDIVGAIRPLHLQPLESCKSVSFMPPPPPPHMDNEDYYDVHSDDAMSSRYASAEDLHLLEAEGGGDGSDVINVQAEEFIAKFYAQIKLQRLQSLQEDGTEIENSG